MLCFTFLPKAEFLTPKIALRTAKVNKSKTRMSNERKPTVNRVVLNDLKRVRPNSAEVPNNNIPPKNGTKRVTNKILIISLP